MSGPGDKEIRMDTGRASSGKTFVRVVHVPTGIEKIQVGLGGESSRVVGDRLIAEIKAEIISESGAGSE